MWTATGTGLTGYDLQTRKLVASWPIAGASAVAYDATGNKLYVGTDGGELLALDTTLFDSDPGGSPYELPFQPESVTTLDGAISHLATFDSGGSVAAVLPGDTVTIVDPGSGTVTGSAVVPGAVDMTDAGSGDAVVAAPADVDDPSLVADRLASILGGDAASYEALLSATDQDQVVIAAPPDSDARKSLDTAVSDGTLAGVSVQPVPELAVAGSDGVTILGSTGAVTAKVAIDGGAHGLALVSGVDDGTQLYVSSQDTSKDPQLSIIAVSGTAAKEGPVVTDTMPMPGALTKVVFDEASEMVEVLGTAPDGSASTMYVVETHGNERVRRPARPVRAGGLGARPQPGLPDRQTAASC